MTMLTSALEYWDAGIKIAACNGRTKLLDQSSFADRAAVEAYFTANPDANIAILTGTINGLFVVDVDVRPKPGQDPFQGFIDFEARYGTLPTTPVRCDTPSGGYHLYFKFISAALATRPQIGSGVDARADNNYVLAPPSLKPNGSSYTWTGATLVGNKDSLPVAPQWLVDLATNTYPESWPTPTFSTLLEENCWNQAVGVKEREFSKYADDFNSSEWAAVQAWYTALLPVARSPHGSKLKDFADEVTAVDTVTVTTA